MVPFSEAKVFRTDRGFIIKDNDDQEWCKYIPFDDLDRIKTDIACRTLEPEQITAMKTMPIPSFSKHPKDLLDEIQASFEKLCTKTQQPGEQEEEENERISLGSSNYIKLWSFFYSLCNLLYTKIST